MLRGLSPYRVLTRLARGGQGEVFLALDTRVRRRVCIKVYHFESGQRARRRVEAEAWRLASVDSPQVLRVLDVVAHAGRVALVTPYIPGCTLDAMLAGPADKEEDEACLDPQDAVAIASDIATGLAALRRTGLVHGDLSPGNILINDGGRAVIADFGAALQAGRKPRALTELSSSPEQLRGEPVSLASDFFALGLLLHRMLTGRHPFLRNGRLDQRAMLRGPASYLALDAIPGPARDALTPLLTQLLAPAPGDRPADTLELRESLRAIRAVLPAPSDLGRRARETEPRFRELDEAPGTGLPSVLIQLPWWRQAGAALRSYWLRGSPGSRLLLAGVFTMPVLIGVLMIVQPGPCIAVESPAKAEGMRAFPAAPDQRQLRALLTEALKNSAPSAQVLGVGPSSDTVYELSPAGVRNVCTPRRRVHAIAECLGERCSLELVGRIGNATRRSRADLPRLSSDRDLRRALAQLIRDQKGFLL